MLQVVDHAENQMIVQALMSERPAKFDELPVIMQCHPPSF